MYILQINVPSSFFDNLKEVAGSPYALAGYIVLIITWAILSFRSYRLKVISESLKHLKEDDRKQMLQTDYGYYLKEGMTAKEFIKTRRNNQNFYIIISLIIAITTIILVALSKDKKDYSNINSSKKELCDAVFAIVNQLDSNFQSIKGNKLIKYSDSDQTTFDSKLIIPGSNHDHLILKQNSHNEFWCSLYNRGDKTLAYKTYATMVNDLTKCLQDWIEIPANTDAKEDGILEYTSFVKDSNKVTITYDFDDEDSIYASSMLIAKVSQ